MSGSTDSRNPLYMNKITGLTQLEGGQGYSDMNAGSMFDMGANPYQQGSVGTESGAIMSNENLMKPALTPNIDFSKKSMAAQAPAAPTASSQVLNAGTGAAMAFGAPPVAAAALALQTLKGIADAKAAQARAKYEAKLAAANATQNANTNLASLGKGMTV